MEYKPMNAKKCPNDMQEKFLDDPQYIAGIKADGYRSICKHGRFYSRLNNDLTDSVPHLHEIFKGSNVTLDGELVLGNTSSDVTRVLGSLPDRAMAQQSQFGNIKYIVFDILEIDGSDLTQLEWCHRRQILENFWGLYFSNKAHPSKYVMLSQVHHDKRKLLAEVTANGGEGIMLKNIHAKYQCDKRPSDTWYKLKRHETIDAVITGFTEGKGKYLGLIGAIEFGLYDTTGQLVTIGRCSGMTDEERKKITGNQMEYIGTVMEVGYMQKTNDGHLRHPVVKGLLRSDKLPEQCTMGQL